MLDFQLMSGLHFQLCDVGVNVGVTLRSLRIHHLLLFVVLLIVRSYKNHNALPAAMNHL